MCGASVQLRVLNARGERLRDVTQPRALDRLEFAEFGQTTLLGGQVSGELSGRERNCRDRYIERSSENTRKEECASTFSITMIY